MTNAALSYLSKSEGFELGISRPTFYELMNKLGIPKPE